MQQRPRFFAQIIRCMVSSIAVLVMAFVVHPASAQLPDEIMNATGSISVSQRQTIRDFIDQTLEQFKAEDPRESRLASRQLDAPLARRQSTRVFRSVYAQELVPRLSNLVGSDEVPMHTRLGSLLILGSLANEEVIPALSTALRSDLEAIRYNAALGYQRTFEVMQAGQHAFVDERQSAREIVRELRAVMDDEKSPYVFGVIVSACVVSPDGPYALTSICEGLEEHVRARHRDEVPEMMIGMYEIALERALKRYISLLGSSPELSAQESALVRAGFAALQLAVEEGRQDSIEDRFRQDYIDLVEAAQSLLDVVCGLSSRSEVNQQQRSAVLAAFKGGNYDQAQQVIDEFWLAPDGPIYGYPKLRIPAGSLDNILEGG